MTAGDASVKIWKNANDYLLYDNYTNAQTSKLMNFEYQHIENYPKKLKVTLSNADTDRYNILSATFQGWSNGALIAAVDIGDYVGFGLAPTTTGTVVNVFWGVIADIQPDFSSGTVTLVCDELSEMYEGIKSNKLVFSHFRDGKIVQDSKTTAANYWALTGITESVIALPFSKVEFCASDSIIETYTPGIMAEEAFTNGQLAQKWLNLDADALFGLSFTVTNLLGSAHTLTVVLHPDNGSGKPNTAITLATSEIAIINASSGFITYTTYFTPWTAPIAIVPGQVYWFRFVLNASDVNTKLQTDQISPYPTFPSFEKWDGAAWVTNLNESIGTSILLGKYETIGWTNCTWQPTTLFVKVINTVGTSPHKRGRVSFYYSGINANQIASALTGLSQPLSGDLALNYAVPTGYLSVKTFPIWCVGNNYVGASIRELADMFCVNVSGVNYQAAVSHYNGSYTPAGANYLKWSRRQTLLDASVMTLSVAGVDNEVRLISSQNFRKSAKRPASVMVVGQDAFGLPVVAHRDDKGLTNSFRTKTKLMLTEYITDSNITTLQQADEIAKARLDLNVLDVWEGELTISGTYPDLMDVVNSSNTYGSGKIITLTYPMAGLSAQKFKVKQILVTPNSTVIQVSNYDILVENNYTESYAVASRSATILAPTNVDTNVFIKINSTAIWTGAAYMELQNAAGTAIGSRVLCTKFTDPTRDTNIYHAEFEAGNGTTTDVSTTWVAKIGLYTEITAGSLICMNQLGATYYTPKWSGTRIIVDFATKD